MSKISLLGSEITLEFEGVFENASIKNNVNVAKHTTFIQTQSVLQGASVIEWRFRSQGGLRGVYAAYASEDILPCELIVNGELLQSNALSESTGGSTQRSVDWRYQANAFLVDGDNVVTLRREGAFPRIAAIGVGTPPRSSNVPIDVYAEDLHSRRASALKGGALSIVPENLSGLVREIQKIAHNDGATISFQSVLSHLVTAVVEDAADGQARIGFGGPLNGQQFRQRIFNRMLYLGIDAIVETGAYRGTSTAFFARQGLPVYSCELNPAYFASAAVQTASCHGVSLYLQDSRSFLRMMSKKERIFDFPLFYLDAHWHDDLPLADEISVITGAWHRYVIMVDDFEVPGTGYGYDRYPNGLELTLSYLTRNNIDLSQTTILFPSASSTAETGKRRGTLILVPDEIYEKHLAGERLLYRYEPDV